MELLVVNYHYVSNETYEKGIYPVSTDQLASHIALLKNAGWLPITPLEVLDILDSDGMPEQRYFLLSFDDGLKCHLYEATRVLEENNVTGVFFVPTCILEGKGLFVNKVHYIRCKLPDEYVLEATYSRFPELRDLETGEDLLRSYYRYDTFSAARLKYLLNFVLARYGESRENLIDELLHELLDEETFVRQTYMNQEELQKLSKKHCLGSHGTTHKPLGQLSDQEIYDEITGSVRILENIVDKKLHYISYPYGWSSAVSQTVVDACLEAGLKVGFTMERGCNANEDFLHNPLLLKRIDANDIQSFIT